MSDSEIKEAYEQVDKETITALKKAADNIRKFAEMQLKSIKEFTYTFTGITLKQKILPIKRVGCYVPGGNYPLPSTALMTVIPAKTAGVKEVIVCSPKIKPVTIVAADIAGADAIYRIGGVQAIAAIPCINELNIGHSIVARALFIGMQRAVAEMKALMVAARKQEVVA